MSLLSEMKTILTELEIPVETGIFSKSAPDTYAVLYPLYDDFDLYSDDIPEIDSQNVRIELFSKSNYITIKNSIVRSLIQNDITITARQYLGFEETSKYHHYCIDAEKIYQFELED